MSAESTQHQETILAGKYRLLRLLKEGGMGSVYVAEQIKTEKKVAIKLLNDDATDDSEAVLRLYNEASAASSVGHSGIVSVLELDTDEEGTPFLVMELLEGESLDDLLQREQMLAPDLASDLVVQALSALSAAHQTGIVHRDLKPENIFITKSKDGRPQVKILDFGISKIWRKGVPLNLTQTGTIWGTPYYMSPEHARGAKDIDGQTDIWAMGVILYQMLTGRLPYEGDTYNELLAKILGDSFPRPVDVNPDIPGVLEDVVLRALTKDRDKRYETADTFQEELIEASEGSVRKRWIPGGRLFRTRVDQPRRKGSYRWLIPWIVLVLLLGALTGLFATGALSWSGARTNATNEPEISGGAGPPSPIGSDQVIPPSNEARVRVQLFGLPDGVEVSFDGRVMRENPFEVQREDRPVVLQLQRDDEVIAEATLIPDHELLVYVDDLMSRSRSADGGSDRADAAPLPSEPSPDPSLVEVRIRVSPVAAPAHIRVDGRRAPQGLARVHPGGIHRITVSAPGYRRQEIHRRITEDTVVEVRLVAEVRRSKRGTGPAPEEDQPPRYRHRQVDIVTEYPQ